MFDKTRLHNPLPQRAGCFIYSATFGKNAKTPLTHVGNCDNIDKHSSRDADKKQAKSLAFKPFLSALRGVDIIIGCKAERISKTKKFQKILKRFLTKRRKDDIIIKSLDGELSIES